MVPLVFPARSGKEKSYVYAENIKHPKVDPLGMVLTAFKIRTGLQKYSKNIEGANLHPPPLFAG